MLRRIHGHPLRMAAAGLLLVFYHDNSVLGQLKPVNPRVRLLHDFCPEVVDGYSPSDLYRQWPDSRRANLERIGGVLSEIAWGDRLREFHAILANHKVILFRARRVHLSRETATAEANKPEKLFGPPTNRILPESEENALSWNQWRLDQFDVSTAVIIGQTETGVKVYYDQLWVIDVDALGRALRKWEWTENVELPWGETFEAKGVAMSAYDIQRLRSEMGNVPFQPKYQDGKLAAICGWIDARRQLKGVMLSGPTQLNYEDGTTKAVLHYQDNKRTGTCRFWDQDGALTFFGNYKQIPRQEPKLDGAVCLFHEGRPWLVLKFDSGSLKAACEVSWLSTVPKVTLLQADSVKLKTAITKIAEIESQINDMDRALREHLLTCFNAVLKINVAMKNAAARGGRRKKSQPNVRTASVDTPDKLGNALNEAAAEVAYVSDEQPAK